MDVLGLWLSFPPIPCFLLDRPFKGYESLSKFLNLTYRCIGRLAAV